MATDAMATLVAAMVTYLQSAGVSRSELARYAEVPVEQLSESRAQLTPSQLQRVWQLIQTRLLPSLTLGRKVRAIISESLCKGCTGVDHVAAELNMSRHTLYKKLKAENLTFLSLLDEVRCEQALAYLHDTDRSLLEVAELLGFSELSAFSRAFKRWMGRSPNAFRCARQVLPAPTGRKPVTSAG